MGGSTPPAPTPTPTPGAPHYEKPPCPTGDCPQDVPDGVTAEPTCALQDTSGNKYCALLCQSDDMCGSDESAECAYPQAGGPGICVYKDSSNGIRTFMNLMVTV